MIRCGTAVDGNDDNNHDLTHGQRAPTIIVDENGTINVQDAAIVTVQAEAPKTCLWQINLPSELQHSQALTPVEI